MAQISKNNVITMHRGDSFIIPVALNVGTGFDPIMYEMQEDDIVYFGLMEPNQKWEDALLKKVFTFNNWRLCGNCVELEMSTEDTEHLIPGVYYYQIKLYIDKDPRNHNKESVTTIVGTTKINILE